MAAKFLTDQHRELQQLARDRHDVKLIKAKLRQPDQLSLNRAAEDQNREYKERIDKRQRTSLSPRIRASPAKGNGKTAGNRAVGSYITREGARTKAEIMTTDGKRAPQTKMGARRMTAAVIATGEKLIDRKAKGERTKPIAKRSKAETSDTLSKNTLFTKTWTNNHQQVSGVS